MAPRKSAARKSPARKSRAKKCKEGMVWRKAHSRTLRNGESLYVEGKCVHIRGQKAVVKVPLQKRKSPPKKSRAHKCDEGMVWRKAHSRTLRSGVSHRVAGKCVHSRGHKAAAAKKGSRRRSMKRGYRRY